MDVLRKLGLLQPAYILEFFTPLFPQQLASGALAGLQLQYFWISTAAIFSITCLLLAAASFITPRTWQQRTMLVANLAVMALLLGVPLGRLVERSFATRLIAGSGLYEGGIVPWEPFMAL